MDKFVVAHFTGINRKQKGSMKIWDYATPDGDWADTEAIKTFFGTHSKCGLLYLSQHEQLSITSKVALAGANLDRRLTVTARPAGTVGGRNQVFTVPAPSVAGVVGAHGERMSKANGATLVTAWKTANGLTETFTFKRGVYTQHK